MNDGFEPDHVDGEEEQGIAQEWDQRRRDHQPNADHQEVFKAELQVAQELPPLGHGVHNARGARQTAPLCLSTIVEVLGVAVGVGPRQ